MRSTLKRLFQPRESQESQKRHVPVICACHVNGRVGVVLREDYNRGSQEYWCPYYTGAMRYDHGNAGAPHGRQVFVEPVFVFNRQAREYFSLVYPCYVEEAIFYVPHVREEELNPISAAWEHIHKTPWHGILMTW